METGLGGGVGCEAREGYHLREADLYFEVVDPISGRPLPDGQPGEIAFTTLTRQAMPLIRYLTGDLAMFLKEPCPCGTSLRRLGKVQGRMAGGATLGPGRVLSLADLDEVLFTVPGLLNYLAELDWAGDGDCLSLKVYTRADPPGAVLAEAARRLEEVPAVSLAAAEGRLTLGPVSLSREDWPTDGTVKRILVDKRMERG